MPGYSGSLGLDTASEKCSLMGGNFEVGLVFLLSATLDSKVALQTALVLHTNHALANSVKYTYITDYHRRCKLTLPGSSKPVATKKKALLPRLKLPLQPLRPDHFVQMFKLVEIWGGGVNPI